MDPVGEGAHSVVEPRVPEDAGLLAQGAHAGGLEAGDVHVLDVPRGAADPGEAVIDPCHPVVDEVLEAGVVGGEGSGPAAVRWHEQPVREAHGAYRDGFEGPAETGRRG